MWGLFEKIFGRRPSGEGWDVRVERMGRGGPITYTEGTQEVQFDFELGDAGIIYCPPSEGWDHRHPWAAGRRSEILDRVAAEFIRREFRGCRFEFEQGRDDVILIRRAPRA
jgi:hypothetical protein